MRIRTIKPEFWASESMGRLDRDTRLVFIGLWSLADDQGRFRADPRFIAGQVFPYDEDGVDVASRALASLRECSSITLYEVGGSKYGVICHWKDHQKIDRPSQSRLPQPPETSLANPREDSTSPREPSCEDQGEDQGKEGIRDQGGEQQQIPIAAFVVEPPDRERIEQWTKEDFWRAAECTRRELGYPPQKWPDPRALSRWWGEARGVADVARLGLAFERFTQDKHWREATPPAPFGAFMSKWADFLPKARRSA